MDDARNRSPLDDKQRQERERQELADAKANSLFSESTWSIDRALFWAATRDRNAMAEYFSSDDRAVFREVFRDDQLRAVSEHLNRLGTTSRATLDDLIKAARHGDISIEGRERGASSWTLINSGDWGGGESPGGLEIFENSDHGPYASDPDVRHRQVWNDLRVYREQVIDAFPEHEPDTKAQIHVSSPWADDEYARANREFQERPWWVRSTKETINDVLGDAANGLLSGAEVEAIARERGWPDPMSSWKADSPGVFEQDHWNFAMAVAWICWRRDDAVREVWPYWLERHYHWRKTTVDRLGPDGTQVRVRGQVLEPFDPSHATVFRSRSLARPKDSSHLPLPAISIEDGLRDLLSRLRAGDVDAIRRGTRVPPAEWLALTHDGYHNGPQYVGIRRDYALDWEILIPTFEVLKLWPKLLPNAGRGPGAEVPNKVWQDAFVSASAWYKAVGMDEARRKLLEESKTPSEATMAISAAKTWNADMPEKRQVKPSSLERSLRKRS
jgi:hypothetical protein